MGRGESSRTCLTDMKCTKQKKSDKSPTKGPVGFPSIGAASPPLSRWDEIDKKKENELQ